MANLGMTTSRIGDWADSRQSWRSLWSDVCRLTSARGFTLIELLFVVLALGFLLVSAAPSFSQGWSSLQTERTAFDVAQLLRTARTIAVSQAQPIDWRWDDSLRCMCLGASQTDGCSTGRLPGRFGRSRTLPEPVRWYKPAGHVRFFPDGTSEPATLLIGDESAPRYQITVDETTGQVVVQTAPRHDQ